MTRSGDQLLVEAIIRSLPERRRRERPPNPTITAALKEMAERSRRLGITTAQAIRALEALRQLD